jgi:hypothetical protein
MAGSDTTKDDDALDADKEAFEAAQDAADENYKAALDDFQFARLAEQWPLKIRRQRELDGRPCLTINRLPSFIRQVVNDARQNKPSINVHPVDSDADPETAEIINGLFRHIEQSSDADVAYDTALEHAVTGGFGYFGLNTRYASDDGFEQDLVIEAKPNCFSIYGDPASTAADSSDWNSAFELSSLTKKAFEARWKGADAVSFEGRGVGKTAETDGENITIAACWSRDKSIRMIVALSAPSLDADEGAVQQALPLLTENLIVDLKVFEANKALFDAIGVAMLGQPREVPSFKVTQRMCSGADVLETNAWAGKYIPIVPVYGEDINIEGKRHFRSLVRDAKDPQRMFNYWRTTSTELVALAPKTPFIGAVGSFVTDAEKWATANTETHAYIEYDPVPNGAPPQRQQFASMPAGAIQEALNASDDMKSIMGLHDASLGARSNETSGVAIMARQREGDVSSFHFIDNLSRAIRHAGRVGLDLIPTVYSTQRMLRILGPEGDAKVIRCAPGGQWSGPLVGNSPRCPQSQLLGMPSAAQSSQQSQGAPEGSQRDEANELARVFDLTVGKYDLVVTAGPSYTTQREEAASQMIELIRAYPSAAPIMGDLVAKNLDWPGAEEIANRFKAMLPHQLQGDNPEADALKAQVQQLAQVLGQAKAKITELETDASIEQQKVNVSKFDAETKRLGVEFGKAGAPIDPAQALPFVMASLVHILGQPDLIEAAQNGADPQTIMAALQQRMGQPPANDEPQPMSGGGGMIPPLQPPAPPMAPPATPPAA